MLWHLPLEKLDMRYTANWYRWFAKEYTRYGVGYVYIDGDTLTETITTGRFLDVYSTIHYKSTQIAKVAELFAAGTVKDGDVFFTCDLWQPGIEAIRYMSQLGGIKVKIYGVLHDGTYDHFDFTYQAGLEPWAQWSERGWIAMCDKVFVASQYHKDELIRQRQVNFDHDLSERVVVTGLPFYPSELEQYKVSEDKRKLGLIVFPHRLNPEKNPQYLDEVQKRFPDLEVIKTHDRKLNKTEYYELLAHADVAISFADQEMFGYGMLEAAALGCSIVVPNRICYKEMYPTQFKYDDLETAYRMIDRFIDVPESVPDKYLYCYEDAIRLMLVEMEMIK